MTHGSKGKAASKRALGGPSAPARRVLGQSAKWAVGFALAIAAHSQGGTSPIVVSFQELVNHPEQYNGTRVCVRAYLVTSCVHCREFWASVEASRDSRVHDSHVQNWISFGALASGSRLPREISERLNGRGYDGYVSVTGTFQYKRITPATALTGFGWGRLNDKQITNVTELRPLGPPIPAEID